MLKRLFAVLLMVIVTITTGCSTKETRLPEDYSFSLTWGVYGVSSYDSSTGKLVKTTDATKPEDYVTTYMLTESEQEEIREILSDLDLKGYPEEYDPFNSPNSAQKVMTRPSQDIILTVFFDDEIVEIKAIDIALSGTESGYNSDARAFLKAVERIKEILLNTDEWQALPEYEFLYD